MPVGILLIMASLALLFPEWFKNGAYPDGPWDRELLFATIVFLVGVIDVSERLKGIKLSLDELNKKFGKK